MDMWWAISEEGALICALGLPLGTEVAEFGEDYVLMKKTDELDMEHIELFDLMVPSTVKEEEQVTVDVLPVQAPSTGSSALIRRSQFRQASIHHWMSIRSIY